uniref:Helicase ATP-binding domain-containing protein n=1 Tax=Kalanchoe fedtschenkoi TaxID=63787 RepID=A0A7N0VCB1_KALFE
MKKRLLDNISDDDGSLHNESSNYKQPPISEPRAAKRVLLEISDDEWENQSFNPSRVFSRLPPPPIESFAFTSPFHSDDEEDDCVEISPIPPNREIFEDDDVDKLPPARTRGRRFVINDDDTDEEEAQGTDTEQVKSTDYLQGFDNADVVVEERLLEEEDVIGNALGKCAKISEHLKRELYGSSSIPCDRFAEVESSSLRIVTQGDVEAACRGENPGCPSLKPYQLVGVNFLMLLHRKGVGGAILADEMGLGKTVQALTYLNLLNHLNNVRGPHLVVCPASVLENWEREFKRWCPSLSVIKYHGATRTAYSKELRYLSKTGKPPPFHALLVCYSLFERHSVQQKDDRKILKRWKWSCVLMDEAHALKDKNSYRWKNLTSLARNAEQRLMLTGTPLQNDLHELWSLLEFMLPDIFATGDMDLKRLLNVEDRDLIISHIKAILGPFILRRLKSDVMQQLVPKTQQVEYVHMGNEQQKAYKEAIEEYRAAARAPVMRLYESNSNSIVVDLPQRQISNYFVQFRKIANHPLLVRRLYNNRDVTRFANMFYTRGTFGSNCSLERVIQELKSYSDFSIHSLLLCHGIRDANETLLDEHVMASAKCQALAELLPALKEDGHRVLIFSQWTSMLDILERALDVIGLTYKRLDGSDLSAGRLVASLRKQYHAGCRETNYSGHVQY